MKIDLHGLRHYEVPRKLDIFFWEMMQKNLHQVEVVTGISDKMKNIVINTCKDYGFEINEMYFNPGSLIINLN
jgi:DNA-nicking Smr family endonuclease